MHYIAQGIAHTFSNPFIIALYLFALCMFVVLVVGLMYTWAEMLFLLHTPRKYHFDRLKHEEH
jgi:hypothetical protein